jgi:hypothetical protein
MSTLNFASALASNLRGELRDRRAADPPSGRSRADEAASGSAPLNLSDAPPVHERAVDGAAATVNSPRRGIASPRQAPSA